MAVKLLHLSIVVNFKWEFALTYILSQLRLLHSKKTFRDWKLSIGGESGRKKNLQRANVWGLPVTNSVVRLRVRLNMVGMISVVKLLRISSRCSMETTPWPSLFTFYDAHPPASSQCLEGCFRSGEDPRYLDVKIINCHKIEVKLRLKTSEYTWEEIVWSTVKKREQPSCWEIFYPTVSCRIL